MRISGAPAVSGAGTWTLGHRAELDGVRGLAIILVLVAHLDLGQFTGAGEMGVTVFFTLSGFLISSLLLEERARSGRIALVAFYRRRALRLMPALIAAVAVVLLAGVVVDTHVSAGGAFASVFYAANYYAMATEGATTWLSHTWTLAIEEQFYILWPSVLLLALRYRGRSGVMWVAGVGIVAGLCWRSFLLAQGSNLHAAYGFDARVDALLVGCWLAAWMHGRPATQKQTPIWLVPLMLCLVPFTLTVPFFTGVVVPDVTPALTALVIGAAVRGDGVGWLRNPGLGLIGRRSYGLYLWNFIAITGLSGALHDRPWLVQVTLMLALSFTLTALSWRFVETPFLAMKDRQLSRAGRVHLPALC